jgi:hypothetical protein
LLACFLARCVAMCCCSTCHASAGLGWIGQVGLTNPPDLSTATTYFPKRGTLLSVWSQSRLQQGQFSQNITWMQFNSRRACHA